ncbi:MAG: hypothetical protein C4291_07260 [Candidatus Dadabacteria bacterium]
MKIIYYALLILTLSTSFAFAQGPAEREITVYDPADAFHPFKLISLAIRPPIALLNIFVRGGYYVLDSYPIRRAFDIDYQPSMDIDEDY